MTTSATVTTTALLVDRDADTRRMFAEYLRLDEWNVEEASDGREALAKAITTRPDVVVTETRLPGINGLDLCGLLRRDSATRTIPIVIVTGDAFAEDLERANEAGADAVLVKPCLPEALIRELRRLLAHSRDLRERGIAIRGKISDQIARSDSLLDRSRQQSRRVLSRAHNRHDTTTPPITPPALVCPQCDQPLVYRRSHIGGVSARHTEQWDYFECEKGCGTFQYRERTRKTRKIS